MGFKVTVKGHREISSQTLKLIKDLSKEQVTTIALETVSTMRNFIRLSIERAGSTGNLEKSILAEPLLGDGYGVGNVNYLNKQVPYWAWINYGVAGTGRRIPPPVFGHFEPESNGRLTRTDPFFKIEPNKPISPHNYIANTVLQIPSIVQNVFNRIRRF